MSQQPRGGSRHYGTITIAGGQGAGRRKIGSSQVKFGDSRRVDVQVGDLSPTAGFTPQDA